jgi:class 3 adenylate cyclase
MPRETASLAILFADIAKSSHLYEVLGNQTAQNLIGTYLSILSDITKQHNGTVVKTIGDEIMCTFPTANEAVDAAKLMHQDLEQMTLPGKPEYGPPNIYVGIHLGPVVREDNDVFGDAVNVAARMVSLAKQRQILTTGETVKALTVNNQNAARCIDRTTIKGKSGEVDIYEVVWEQHDLTVMLDTSLEELSQRSSMELRFGKLRINIDKNRPIATMGRQPHNDLIVNDNRVSRSHARIEYRRNKFILIDQSTNGTFVIIMGKKNIHIKRDETQLHGHGVIGLGRETTQDSPMAIQYAIKL